MEGCSDGGAAGEFGVAGAVSCAKPGGVFMLFDAGGAPFSKFGTIKDAFEKICGGLVGLVGLLFEPPPRTR